MLFKIDGKGCWNFLGTLDKDGYGKIALKGISFRAHRLMAHITIKPMMYETDVVAHSCDNPACINPAHLFLTTHLGNARDRDEKGRGAIGERHPFSKLTPEKVISIRALYASGESLYKIAPKFMVSASTIYAVVKRKVWKHVP